MNNQNLKNQESILSLDSLTQENTKDLVPQSLSQKKMSVSEISQTQEEKPYLWQWSGHEWMLSLKQDCLKTVQPPTKAKMSKRSPQGMFLETFITVGLLAIALWMQAVPPWQPSSNVGDESFSFPAFEN